MGASLWPCLHSLSTHCDAPHSMCGTNQKVTQLACILMRSICAPVDVITNQKVDLHHQWPCGNPSTHLRHNGIPWNSNQCTLRTGTIESRFPDHEEHKLVRTTRIPPIVLQVGCDARSPWNLHVRSESCHWFCIIHVRR
jgi:hypothetical protein